MLKIYLISLMIPLSLIGKTPFGYPGMVPNWSSAKKTHIGTSYEVQTADSPIWFTSAQGILTEVYFPRIDQAQIKDSQFLISDGRKFFSEEKKDLIHEVNIKSPHHVILKNIDPLGRFSISHDFFTIKNSAILVDEVIFDVKEKGLNFYLLFNPSLGNSGLNDFGKIQRGVLNFYHEKTHLQVNSSCNFVKSSIGYEGFSDGYQDLKDNFLMDYEYPEAGPGNIAAMSKINLPDEVGVYKCYVTYSFNTHKSKPFNFDIEKANYHQDWQNYLESLSIPDNLNSSLKSLYLRSLYVLKTLEDKKNPGAFIASPSIPWGENIRVRDQWTGGYHLVWPRDLYEIAMSMNLANDREAALRALRFLKKIQYKKGEWRNYEGRPISKRGAMPQNVWVDGKEYWSQYQADQVGYNVLLFAQIYESSGHSKKFKLLNEFSEFLLLSLDFIKTNGPWSAQDRWEESMGISPSTFSVVTAALVFGDKIFPNRGYYKVANEWLYKKDDNIKTWAFTQNGPYGDGKYFLRVSGCGHTLANWDPNRNMECYLANTMGQTVDQRKMLDQGFLFLSLLGLYPANDEHVLTSLDKINDYLKVETPLGPGWYRYNMDAYGEDSKGRLWPIFGGEQARFYWELYRVGSLDHDKAKRKSARILNTFLNFSNEGLMIPEQVFEDTGRGTGSATPLAWSHAEFIKLAWSHQLNRNVENLLK